MFNGNSPSLADIAAVTGNNKDVWGDGNGWWVLIILFAIFGGWGNGFGGGFLRKVLLHEICHSAMFSYGIDMTLEQEEMFCDFLATYADEIISITNNVFQTLRTAI